MDFLDPRKKRAHRRRLMLGYGLLSIAITLATVILVYGAAGYSVDTKTGQIVENGLLFVDSQPGGASIYLNNKYINETTSARKVLAAGNYSLKLSKSGYRDWNRNFVLDEHRVARYVYPFLFPSTPAQATIKKYTNQPMLLSSSPDRRWLVLVNQQDNSETFEQFDTTAMKDGAKALAVPSTILTSPGTATEYKLVEWATNNKQVLLKRTYNGGAEFLVVDRDNPANSFNVNKKFGVAPAQVALRDKETSQLYLQTADGSLAVANTETSAIAAPILKNILDFKSYGSDLILYVIKSSVEGKSQANIYDGEKSYFLYKFPVGDKYLIDVAKFQDHFYYVAGSSSGNYINIFKDPLGSLKSSKNAAAPPLITLREQNAQKVSFSANARFVAAQAGQNIAAYDLEESQYYKYEVAPALAGPLVWMDGHRFMGASGGNVFVMDYDKTNQQSLLSTSRAEGGLFDREYQTMFTLAPVSSGGFALVSVDMRAGADKP